MQQLIDAFAEDPAIIIPILAILIGPVIAIVAIAFRSSNIKAREHTRREIAAYVAEGSITPDDAERLLAAKSPSRCS